MDSWQAVLLGIIEGLTEFLPVSSTGHLIFFQRLLGIESGEAGFAWAVSIQLGAILAVLVVYGARVKQMAAGLIGRDLDGRRLLVNVIAAFIPAAVFGLLGEKFIADRLASLYVVIAAWAFWGIVILVVFFRRRFMDPTRGSPLETLTWKGAAIIGAFQCLALVPGTSRSLVCILGGIAVGLSLPSAVELSFLLGVVTLGAATCWELVSKASLIAGSFGIESIVIGLLTAFASGILAVKWMVSYLTRHGMTLFGWYRIGIAIVAFALVRLGFMTA